MTNDENIGQIVAEVAAETDAQLDAERRAALRAMGALSEALEAADWDRAIAVATARRGDFVGVMMVDESSAFSESRARAAIRAIDARRLDAAVAILGAVPDTYEITGYREPLRQIASAVAALLMDDAELALARLAVHFSSDAIEDALVERLGEELARAFIAGDAAQRPLSLVAMGLGNRRDDEGSRRRERLEKWQSTHGVTSNPRALLEMCQRRSAGAADEAFDVCASEEAQTAFLWAPDLLSHATLAARRRFANATEFGARLSAYGCLAAIESAQGHVVEFEDCTSVLKADCNGQPRRLAMAERAEAHAHARAERWRR